MGSVSFLPVGYPTGEPQTVEAVRAVNRDMTNHPSRRGRLPVQERWPSATPAGGWAPPGYRAQEDPAEYAHQGRAAYLDRDYPDPGYASTGGYDPGPGRGYRERAGYPESGYADPGYAEPRAYAQPGYAQPTYAQPGAYPEQGGFADPGSTDLDYAGRGGYAEPGYTEPGYGSGAHSESGYAEPGAYGEAGYADSRYSEPGAYAEPRYAEPRAYAEPRYADQGYADPAYTDQGHAEPGYADRRYADPGYADQGYTEPEYVDQGYVDQGYADRGYSDQGYAEQGYVEPGYAEPQWAEHGYAEPGYAGWDAPEQEAGPSGWERDWDGPVYRDPGDAFDGIVGEPAGRGWERGQRDLVAPDAGVVPERWQADQESRWEAMRRGRVAGAVIGLLAVAVLAGVSSLAAVFAGPQASPVRVLAELVATHAPLALHHHGGVALLAAAVVAAIGIGMLSRRSAAAGVTGLAALSLLAAFAVVTRPQAHVTDVLPTVLGGLAAIIDLLWLVRVSAPTTDWRDLP